MVKVILGRLRDSVFPTLSVSDVDTGDTPIPPIKAAAIEIVPPEDPIEMPDPPAEPFKARFPKISPSAPPFISQSLRWSPTAQAMIVDQLKLMYLPIAKNACSSTKRLVANLGGLTLDPGQDIHFTLDKQNTGLQFKDRTEADLRAAFASPDWMRFMIFRDPMDRLVSAYVEKFVNNRKNPEQWATCREVIKTVFGTADPTPEDFAHGITFREFSEFILSRNPKDLNSHWQPQTFYMGHVPLTHMYDVKALDQLSVDLKDHVGTDIDLPHINMSRSTDRKLTYLKTAVDLLPEDLPNAHSLSIESFLDESLHARLSEYYAADLSIYRQIRKTQAQDAIS